MQITITIRTAVKKNTILAEPGNNLLDILQDNNYNISSPCGGKGSCGKCKVKVISKQGVFEPDNVERELLSAVEIKEGYRLACRLYPEHDLEIELKEEQGIQILTDGYSHKTGFNPLIETKKCSLKRKSKNQKAFWQQIKDNSRLKEIELGALEKLGKMDEEEISFIASGDRILDIKRRDNSEIYGLAVDIGTTTIAIYLLDLKNGTDVDIYTLSNPQKKFGADVISRVNYSQENKTGVKKLQQELIKGLNRAISRLVSNNQIEKNDIYQMSIVGNTIMLHTLLGIDASSIALAPYIPVFTEGLDLKAAELNININKNGRVSLLPSVAGYVGADITADLLVTDFTTSDWKLLIDIGTNGEIVLGNQEGMFACSAAAGPAFEGAKITFGMAGVPGAISAYSLSDGSPEYKTIAGKRPEGICGSGLVDIIAHLLAAGFIDKRGGFKKESQLPDSKADFITTYKDQAAFRVIRKGDTALNSDILLTQKDIREFQLARGAIIAGIETLRQEADIEYEDIKEVYLAGGFGNYIDPDNACDIGMIPETLRERITRIGNGAGMGARIFTLNKELHSRTEDIINKIDYIELSLRSDFQEKFMEAMAFA